MTKIGILALLAAAAAPAAAQPPGPPGAAVPVVQPSVDSAAERQALRQLSACLAAARPRWARQTLAEPYLSKDQARAASEAVRGRDNCIRGPQAEFTFRTSTLVGSLAEHFLMSEIDRADSKRLATALNTIEPLNASEDFALCVVASNPVAARQLALSDPGSAAEAEAVAALTPQVKPCFAKGETPSVDVQALRALVATALYRGVTAVLATRS